MAGLSFKGLSGLGFLPLLVIGYAQLIPFPSSYFHQVVSTFPSEFIFSDQALSEIYRVLLPGGKFVLLPVAWITGSGLADRLAAGLFHVTGQAPQLDHRVLQPFEQAGFNLHVETRSFATSQALIIQASKPASIVSN